MNQIGKRRNRIAFCRSKCNIFKIQIFAHLRKPAKAMHIINRYIFAVNVWTFIKKQAWIITKFIAWHSYNIAYLKLRRYQIFTFNRIVVDFFYLNRCFSWRKGSSENRITSVNNIAVTLLVSCVWIIIFLCKRTLFKKSKFIILNIKRAFQRDFISYLINWFFDNFHLIIRRWIIFNSKILKLNITAIKHSKRAHITVNYKCWTTTVNSNAVFIFNINCKVFIRRFKWVSISHIAHLMNTEILIKMILPCRKQKCISALHIFNCLIYTHARIRRSAIIGNLNIHNHHLWYYTYF